MNQSFASNGHGHFDLVDTESPYVIPHSTTIQFNNLVEKNIFFCRLGIIYALFMYILNFLRTLPCTMQCLDRPG